MLKSKGCVVFLCYTYFTVTEGIAKIPNEIPCRKWFQCQIYSCFILCSVYKHVIRTVDDEPGENFIQITQYSIKRQANFIVRFILLDKQFKFCERTFIFRIHGLSSMFCM